MMNLAVICVGMAIVMSKVNADDDGTDDRYVACRKVVRCTKIHKLDEALLSNSQEDYCSRLPSVIDCQTEGIPACLEVDKVRGKSMQQVILRQKEWLQQKCPQSPEHSYYFHDTPVDFATALSNCEAQGQTLAMPKSKSQFDNLIAALTKAPSWDNTATGTDTQVWLGMHDSDHDGVFSWIDGHPLVWSYWHDGQPNNIGRQYCGILFKEGGRIKWGDIECDKLRRYICQTDTCEKGTKSSLLEHVQNMSSLTYNHPPRVVSFAFQLLDIISVRSKRREVELSASVDLRWTDLNLGWDPTCYDNAESITVPSSLVWTPDVAIPSGLTQPVQHLSPLVVSIAHSGYVTKRDNLRLFIKCGVKEAKDEEAAATTTTTTTSTTTTCSSHFRSWTQAVRLADIPASVSLHMDQLHEESMYEVVNSSLMRLSDGSSVEVNFTFRPK